LCRYNIGGFKVKQVLAMRIDILTLFPEMFVSPLADAIFKRAIDKGLVSFNVYNIRDLYP